MNPPIFHTEAPRYWARGLPVIPLIANGKRPAINSWQIYADTFPTEEDKDNWLEYFGAGNIGLPMGATAGLVAVDIDTDDPEILKVLDRLMPPSPWTRVGKKGMIKVFKFNGERTTRIKDAEGNMICEVLSKGTQFVLPPSIHPDTGRPCTANCDLLEVFRSVPALPSDFVDQVKDGLKAIGIETNMGGGGKIATFVPAGNRDNAMVWHAGLLARAVLKGERSLLQALGEIQIWVENFVEQIVGDPVTVEKAQAKLVEFLVRDVTNEKKKALPIGWDEGLTEEDKEKLGLTFTEDDEVWSAERILEFVTVEFERHLEFRSSGRMQAVAIALDRIARAGTAISSLEESMILRFIAAQSASVFSQADLKRQLVAIRRGDIVGENHKELAEATVRFLSEFGEVRYEASQFWQWKGAFWEQKPEHEILKILAEEFGHYPAARKQGDHLGILKVMRAICAKELRVGDIRGVNFANGFLGEDLELVEHSPDQGMTYVLPYRYLPELAGHMPIFNQYLHDSWSEDPDYMDKVDALQEAMGATLMGAASNYQKAFCLYGRAAAGKSTLLNLISGLLPENAISTVAPQDWRERFRPAQLYGKVLNLAGELSNDVYIPGELFKGIVDGTMILGENKNRDPFNFKPTCAHWFASNHLPKTKDHSEGFIRRWLFLSFERAIPVEKRAINLHELMLTEREAITAWAILGFARLREKKRYTVPESSDRIAKRMAGMNNTVFQFLEDNADGALTIGLDKTDDITLAVTLHNIYHDYTIKNRLRRFDLPEFVVRMNELSSRYKFTIEIQGKVDTPTQTRYRGVHVKPEKYR